MRVSKMTQAAPQRDDTARTQQDGPSRRRFLRRAGLVGAATAAFIGGADVIGLTSASAATRHGTKPTGRNKPDCCGAECHRLSCGCKGIKGAGSNGCCDSGSCCYQCFAPCVGNYKACFALKGCPTPYTYCIN